MLVLAASSAAAKGHGGGAEDHGEGKHQAHGGARSSGEGVTVVFSNEHYRILRDYYSANRPAPSGLPPGLAKNLARGKPLPPGWAKKMVPFPVQIERQLPPPLPYTSRGYIDGHVVTVDNRTQLVLDVFIPF